MTISRRTFTVGSAGVLGVTAHDMLNPAFAQGEPIKIGWLAALTGASSAPAVGFNRGVVYAVDSINAAGGVKGRKIELITRDTQGDPTKAVNATQEMISSVVDVAHVLSAIRLDQGDARSAQDAAARGLLVEPGSELLHCDAIRAAALQGDSEEIARLSERLRAQIESIDPDGGVGEDTAALLRQVASFR